LDVIQQLESLAEKIGDLWMEVMVVGGCSPALILDIRLAPDLRPTHDVDIVVQAENYGKYARFIERLKDKGFLEREGDPIGRFVSGDLAVDVIPSGTDVLGFSNRWYKKAFGHAVVKGLPSGRKIRTISSVYFIAAKIEAFRGRGQDDFMASADLEDLLTVLVEYPPFEGDFKRSDRDVQEYISEEFRRMTSNENYPHFLSAHLRGDEASQASLPRLRKLFEKIAFVDSDRRS
jgi:predicted nucleotidyltransferase